MAAFLLGSTGRVIRMTMHHSGNMLVPAFLFAQDNYYPVTVEAITETLVLRLQPSDLETLLHSDQRLMMNFIGILSNIIAYLTKKVGILSMTIREKVCTYHHRRAEPYAARHIEHDDARPALLACPAERTGTVVVGQTGILCKRCCHLKSCNEQNQQSFIPFHHGKYV